MRIVLAFVALSLFMVGPSEAGPKGKLLGLIAEYEDLKKSILAELSASDDNRSQGYSSDAKALLGLSKESLDLMMTADKTYAEAAKTLRADPASGVNLRALYALRMAALALHQAVSTEVSYQLGEKTPFNLMVRAKFEDLLRVAEEELRRAQP